MSTHTVPSVTAPCAKCATPVTVEAATLTDDLDFLVILHPPFLLPVGSVNCARCYLEADSWFLNLDAPEPSDEDNYMIINHYVGI
jgi:hypothetical protein